MCETIVSILKIVLRIVLQIVLQIVGQMSRRHQEIYRPGTDISDASNQFTAVGGDQNKEFRDSASFLRERAQRVE